MSSPNPVVSTKRTVTVCQQLNGPFMPLNGRRRVESRRTIVIRRQ